MRAGAVVAAMAAMATAFAVPYSSAGDEPATPPLLDWLPPLDGDATLAVVTVDGEAVAWRSNATAVIPDLAATLGGDDISSSILAWAGTGDVNGRLPGNDVVVSSSTTRHLSGGSEHNGSVSVVSDRGQALIALTAASGDLVFDPPMQMLPAEMTVGETWEDEGVLGSVGYRSSGEVVGFVDDPRGDDGDGDCLRIDLTLEVVTPDGASPTDYTDIYCRGEGAVGGRLTSTDLDGTVTEESYEVVASGGDALTRAPEPLAPLDVDRPKLQADWTVSTVASPLTSVVGQQPTAVPAVIPGDEPVFLYATEAFAGVRTVTVAADGTTSSTWSVPGAGQTYGAMALDAPGARVFSGSTDGTITATAADGLRLWSRDLGDNVASVPAVVEGTLVVGDEDGDINGLDAATGEQLWRVEVQGPVTSGAADLGGLAVIGGDEGIVRALDPRHGTIEWTLEMDGPVEAPVVVSPDGAVAIVSDRTGRVTAVAADGRVVWDASVDSTSRNAAFVTDDEAVLITGDYGGSLVSFDLVDGSQRWQLDGDFVGPLAAVDGAFAVAATSTGELVAVGDGGTVAETWEMPMSATGGLDGATFSVGPVSGDGAVWAVADDGRVLRLGTPSASAASGQMMLRWLVSSATAPLQGLSLMGAPVELDGRSYLVDRGGGLYAIDPGSGDIDELADLDLDGQVMVPVTVADAAVVVAAQTSLAVVDVPSGDRRWTTGLPGFAAHPPTIVDGALLVATTDLDEGVHHLSAFDIATGTELWHSEVGGALDGALNTVAVVGDVAVTGSPLRAVSVDDGTEVWRSETVASAIGAVAAASEDLVVVSELVDETAAELVAVGPTDGTERWRVPAGLQSAALPPVVTDDAVIIESGGLVVAHSISDGSTLWEHALAGPAFGAGALIDGRLWYPLTDGRVAVLDPALGTLDALSEGIGVDLAAEAFAQRAAAVGDVVVVPFGAVMFAFDREIS